MAPDHLVSNTVESELRIQVSVTDGVWFWSSLTGETFQSSPCIKISVLAMWGMQTC